MCQNVTSISFKQFHFVNLGTMTQKHKNIIKLILAILSAIIATLCTAFGVTSCQVVREITNTSTSHNVSSGDTTTTTTIETRTVEKYKATK